jgi:hypothetical protein
MKEHPKDCGCTFCDYPHIGINGYNLNEDERFITADDIEEPPKTEWDNE